eukprot:3750032-Pyramimonas_sp.AAC.1
MLTIAGLRTDGQVRVPVVAGGRLGREVCAVQVGVRDGRLRRRLAAAARLQECLQQVSCGHPRGQDRAVHADELVQLTSAAASTRKNRDDYHCGTNVRKRLQVIL